MPTPLPKAFEWPLVHERDDGILRAGPPDACFYCHAKVGQEHGFTCVVVQKKVELRVRARLPGGVEFFGRWQTLEPWSWGPHEIEFHKNESSWCCSNFMQERPKGTVVWSDDSGRLEDPWDALASYDTDDACLCNLLWFDYVCTVDQAPVRLVVERVERILKPS
jgi:hypothetical protein